MVDDADSTSRVNPPARSRLSARVLGGGTEPDPRFSLANERTFLAWIRTSLALLAGGVGVEAFAQEVLPGGWRRALAIALILLAMALSAGAVVRWVRVERAMRRGSPLPLSGIAGLLALGVAIACALVILVFVISGR
ncbi:YidH family protein [Cumulibacter manganitolerans]|uniref:YidH family protein n=1 Tax=Cumulibacter manganitolerans TaxID=1884992 RepID=UPI0012963E1E|nr:DUF202 domain-containing protein [Cumulibacter manganitolerans]